MIWKGKVQDLIKKLQQNAVESERDNQRGLKGNKLGLQRDSDYWNGYLDACDNLSKEIKVHNK